VKSRILVPLDGSRLAEQALSCAMTLGRGLPAELVLFRAVSIPSDVQEALDKAGLRAEPLMERLETEANEYLEAMSHLLSETGLSFSHVVRHGLAADAILDFFEQSDIELIVMASHGYTGIKRWAHGSVAERVLQKASAPLLLVRAREAASKELPEASPCRRILVPLDGSRVAEQVLPAVTPIARALGCEVTLFQVPIVYASGSLIGEWHLPLQGDFETPDQVAQDYLDHLASDLRNLGIEASTATWVGPVAESIIDYAKVNDADLIAMCTHGRTGLARWALGSVADRVLRAGDKPILLVRAR
jgi:nucleotide-binding universal stress UspA family protein